MLRMHPDKLADLPALLLHLGNTISPAYICSGFTKPCAAVSVSRCCCAARTKLGSKLANGLRNPSGAHDLDVTHLSRERQIGGLLLGGQFRTPAAFFVGGAFSRSKRVLSAAEKAAKGSAASTSTIEKRLELLEASFGRLAGALETAEWDGWM